MSTTEHWIRPGLGKVIALVHGIGAKDAQEYWQDFLNVLSNDPSLQDFSLFVWKYPTHVEPGIWKNIGSTLQKKNLRETAPRIKQLGAVWDTTYRAQFLDYQDVILICHSMGGLVVKSWIIDLLEQGQSQNLDTLRHISFYNTPHNGAPITTLADWNKQLKDMQLDSPFIEEVGNRWFDHVVAWKKKTPGPDEQRYNRYIPHLVIAGLIDRVVPSTNATIRGMPLTTVPGDHSEAIQPTNTEDTRYRIWRNTLKEIMLTNTHTTPSPAPSQQANNTQPSAQEPSSSHTEAKYATCFISHAPQDEAFAEQLHSDLVRHGVPCWFAPEDMKIGDKKRKRIEQAIQAYDKLLLILSQLSVTSDWVEYEVETAFDKEDREQTLVLFPIRLDNTVIENTTAWAAHIRRTRHIGNFENWTQSDNYQKALSRLLRDLETQEERDS